MLAGIYSATSGMIAQTKKQETISDNLVGASCPGFKRSTAVFSPFSTVLQAAKDAPRHGVVHTGTFTSHTTGEMRPTKQPLDFFIDGDGFFTVQTPAGPLYTRNGSFSLGQNRKLVAGNGYPVLGERGEITIPPGEVKVDEGGNICVNGTNIGRLKLAGFDDTSVLTSVGAGLFQADPSIKPTRPDSDIRQGFLEMSNVSLFREMSDMVYTMRCYETCQKSIVLQDETLGKLINEVGNIS